MKGTAAVSHRTPDRSFNRNRRWWKLFRKTPARPPLPKGTRNAQAHEANHAPEVDPAQTTAALAHGEADAGYPESDSQEVT